MPTKKKQKLKQSNPRKYYRKCQHWLGFGKFCCALTPPVAVLSVYAVKSARGTVNTNPLNPAKFGVGMVLMVVGIVILVANELRRITRESKAANGNEAALSFSSTIAWLFIATILWLFYLTMYWLIIFCFAEVIGTFFSSICSYNIVRCKKLEDKAETAQLNAEAMQRVQEDKP